VARLALAEIADRLNNGGNMSIRNLAFAALIPVVASLYGCATMKAPDGRQPQMGGLFGAMVAPPPAPAPVWAPTPAPAPAPVAQPAGGTVADGQLQRDVLTLIGTTESAVGGNANPALVSTRAKGMSGATYLEVWTVNSNGQLVNYDVQLTPSPKGGVAFGVTRQPTATK
jgi:hypothetical protein